MITDAKKSSGVVITATGDEFVLLAKCCALSIKNASPSLKITLFTNKDISSDVFDKVMLIEGDDRRARIGNLQRTPYDRTLALDCDTFICADITDIFKILDKYDIAMCHAHNRKATHYKHIDLWSFNDKMGNSWDIPYAFPHFNGGVILYRNGDKIMSLFQEWDELYKTKGVSKDQASLRELLWEKNVMLYALPPEYNLLYQDVKRMREGEIEKKIIHYTRDKKRFLKLSLERAYKRMRRLFL